MEKRKVKILFAIFFAISFIGITSCASIIKGRTEEVRVNSNVKGAQIFLDGKLIGKTPYTGLMKRSGKLLMLKKEGYKTKTIKLSKAINPWFWGNAIFGGLLGSSTDSSTGALYTYKPGTIYVELEPVSGN